MRYKPLAAALAMSFAGIASAAGPFDGVYQTGGQQYLSVHQNGGTLIVAAFSTIGSAGTAITAPNGQQFVPARADVWELYSGPIQGLSATLSGQTFYGACTVNITFTFDATGATYTNHNFVNTAAGSAQGVNCAAAFAHAVGPGRAQRIF
jgi:hypothetical protein